MANVVGDGDVGDDADDGSSVAEVTPPVDTDERDVEGFGVAEGMREVRDGGSVVCPDVRTAQMPAKTDVSREIDQEIQLSPAL